MVHNPPRCSGQWQYLSAVQFLVIVLDYILHEIEDSELFNNYGVALLRKGQGPQWIGPKGELYPVLPNE